MSLEGKITPIMIYANSEATRGASTVTALATCAWLLSQGCVTESSKNKFLLDLITLIRGQLERGVVRVLQTQNAIPLSVKEHRNIITEIVARRAEKAHEAMDTHLKAAVRRYQSSISD